MPLNFHGPIDELMDHQAVQRELGNALNAGNVADCLGLKTARWPGATSWLTGPEFQLNFRRDDLGEVRLMLWQDDLLQTAESRSWMTSRMVEHR